MRLPENLVGKYCIKITIINLQALRVNQKSQCTSIDLNIGKDLVSYDKQQITDTTDITNASHWQQKNKIIIRYCQYIKAFQISAESIENVSYFKKIMDVIKSKLKIISV